MNRVALINRSTMIVENVLMVDANYVVPPGYEIATSNTANIGDTYNGTAFTPALPTQAQLQAYAQTKQAKVSAGGISVNVGTQSVEASTDTASLVLLQGAQTMAVASSSATFNWVQKTGVSVTLTAAQIITIFNAVTSFLQSTFNTLSTVLTGISGSTITTFAQIDSAAWPANS